MTKINSALENIRQQNQPDEQPSFGRVRMSDVEFDYPTWAAQGRANADKLPSGVAEALGLERDWADEVARLEEQVRIYRGAQLNAEEKLSREQDNAKGWKLRAERLEEALAKAEAAQ